MTLQQASLEYYKMRNIRLFLGTVQ